MNNAIDTQFEAWARKMSMDLEYRNIPGFGRFYECSRTLLALEAWQASRESLVIELPESSSVHNSEVIKAVGRHLIKQGLKVKS